MNDVLCVHVSYYEDLLFPAANYRFLASVAIPIAFLTVCWPVVWFKMWFTDHITPGLCLLCDPRSKIICTRLPFSSSLSFIFLSLFSIFY